MFLFPHQVLPLHIFEPRYRAMIADLLDGPGRLVIANSDPDDAGMASIAGLGEILRHEKLPDGRYMIWVLGLARVQLSEVACDTLYRQATVLPFHEIDVAEHEADELAQELREAATERLQQPLPLPESTPPGLLADLLLQTLQAPRPIVERAFTEPDVALRARIALQQAARTPLPDTSEGDDAGPRVEFSEGEFPPGAFPADDFPGDDFDDGPGREFEGE